MTTRDKIIQYEDLYSSILDDFGAQGWYQIDIKLDSKWIGDEDYLRYAEQTEDGSYNTYSMDSADLLGEKDGIVMFRCHDNGDHFFAVFSIDNKLTAEEFDELE